MFLPAITTSLGNGINNEQLTWIDRGWKSELDYQNEMNASLQKNSCREDGIVITRAQTYDEANHLVNKLLAIQVVHTYSYIHY
jgi:hypothetical protein